MNRTRLFSVCLFGLGALTAFAADEAAPAQAPKSAAPAVAAPAFTEPQLVEELGWIIGKQQGLKELGFSKEQVELFVKGLQSAAAGNPAPYDWEKARPELETYMQHKQDAFLTKLREQNLSEANTFFEKLKADKDVVELPDGLRYKVVQAGTGAYPKATDTVKVNYSGALINGAVFDSSAEKPVEFALNQVIPGWTEGLQKINAGGKIKLFIPPQLAYGDDPKPGIPPGSTLVFDVELLEVKAAAPAPAPQPEAK